MREPEDSDFEQALQAADVCWDLARRALDEAEAWKRRALGWIGTAFESLGGDIDAFLDPLPPRSVPGEAAGVHEEG